MNKKSKYLLNLGFIGILVILILNIFSLYYLEKNNAIFFSNQWNNIWLPNYIVWFVILTIGIVLKLNIKKSA